MIDKKTEQITNTLMQSDLTNARNLDMLFQVVLNTENKELNEFVYNKAISNVKAGYSDSYSIYRKSLLYGSRYEFDKYMIQLEINRNPEDRFYLPRRKVLLPLVNAMQMLIDDELDELFLSLPPRIGKTTLLMFFVTFIIGKNSELTNLYSAFSDGITSAFYKGLLEVITDNVTYTWNEIFPDAVLASTNAAEETLDIDRRKRYHSITCRSLYGTLNGACDCNGFLLADDLLSGIEEAISPDRLDTAWRTVDNNLLPRGKGHTKILWCGTRWSQNDPAGRRMELVQNDATFRTRRYKIINVPALNKDDESNFNYEYGVGFSTEYYIQRRASFERNGDIASWVAQYMGEPIERQGTVFEPDTLRYFNGNLPCEPSRIFMTCDPAFGGGDFVACPICAECGEDVYIIDVVYSNLEKDVTQSMICERVIRHNISALLIECTKTTMAYKEGIEKMLDANKRTINIKTQFVSSIKSKNDRIMARAPEIRKFYFLEDGKRSKEYQQFMNNVFSFKQIGKNKHDDAPDSLAMVVDMLYGDNKITVMRKFM